MTKRIRLRHLPTRLATGAFILNSGLSKLGADDETAKHVHAMAVGTYPFLEKMDPKRFTTALAASEITLGGALLLPIVPSWLSGLGLSAFSGGLLGLYMKTPGMREAGSIRPTRDGQALAKDAWMFGIGLSLLMDRGRSAREVKGELKAKKREHQAKDRKADHGSKGAKAAKAAALAGAAQAAVKHVA